MATKTATAMPTVGPESWRNNTLRTLRLSQNLIRKSDRNCTIGRSHDPLPHMRDVVAELSNDEVRRYTRDVRTVVVKLRYELLATDDEIKMAKKSKDALEKALENKRKDLRLNHESREIRLCRPVKEKERDGADDLLNAERAHLINLKKALEVQLRSIQQHLVVLDSARKRLIAVLQERTRVMDLLCHTQSSTNGRSEYVPPNSSRRSASALDDLPLDKSAFYPTDPLGSFTPEVEMASADCQDARHRSIYLRQEIKDAIDKTEKLQKAAQKSVTDGLTQKLAETVTLKQHLAVGLAGNRHSLNQAQRWFDATDRARSYTLGPVKASDLMCRERLDRPLVRVFQRHSGTQLPEAQEIVRGSNNLNQSLVATGRHIGLMRLMQDRIKDDMRNKTLASSVDSSIIRLRRRKADHRWTVGTAF